MTLSVNQIRTMCGPMLEGYPSFLVSAATSGSTSTLVDTVELVKDFGAGYYKDAWILRTAKTNTDRVRQAITYAPSTGTLTVNPIWAVAVATDAYELWRTYHPVQEVEAAVIRAMRTLRIPEILEFTPVASQRQYDVSASPISATWLVHPNQFVRLDVREGDTSGQYTYRAVTPQPVLTMDESAVVLNLVGTTYGSADTLRLVAHRSAESAGSVVPLAAGADTVPLANDQGYLTYAACLAARELLRRGLARRLSPEVDAERQRRIADLTAEIRQWRRTYRTVEPRSVFATERRPWGPGVNSWMG